MNKSAQFDSDEDSYDDPTYNPAPVNSSVSEFSELSKIGNPLNSVNWMSWNRATQIRFPRGR